MFQFGEVGKNTTTKSEMMLASNGRGMSLPGLTWLVLLAAILMFFLPIDKVAASPTASTRSFMEACQVKHNITMEELDEFPDEPDADEVEMKFKCYAHCLLFGMGLLDENGKLNVEYMHDVGILTDPSYESMLECKAANDMEDDPCEYSFGMMLCARMLGTEEGGSEENIEDIEEEVEAKEEEERRK
ncbi:general odorant-binding protein 57c [Ceratitis capitata]|uniref:general odorant-binding protein 57c n=1 Tax=Ceratitis capitata TaxID=7213 RepID=UPI000329CCBE|nr:general odorant-binding protein 57c [Ceratitis capitata]